MTGFVWKDASVVIDGEDLSDHVISVTLNTPTDLIDSSTMGTDARRFLPGLIGWSFDVTFKQDFDSGSVDDVLSGIRETQQNTNLSVEIKVRKDASNPVSVDNPEYRGNVFLGAYNPMDGSIGTLATSKATFQSDSDLTRDVTP